MTLGLLELRGRLGLLDLLDRLDHPDSGLPAGLYAFNSGGISLDLGINDPVPFNTVGSPVGTAISQLDADTFVISETRIYKITVIANTATASLLGGLTIQDEWIPVPGTGSSLISLGAPIVIQAITQITDNSIIS